MAGVISSKSVIIMAQRSAAAALAAASAKRRGIKLTLAALSAADGGINV
jgi:hypothetical protein